MTSAHEKIATKKLESLPEPSSSCSRSPSALSLLQRFHCNQVVTVIRWVLPIRAGVAVGRASITYDCNLATPQGDAVLAGIHVSQYFLFDRACFSDHNQLKVIETSRSYLLFRSCKFTSFPWLHYACDCFRYLDMSEAMHLLSDN